MAGKKAPQIDRARWEAEVYRPAIERYPERRPAFETSSGIPVPPVLGQETVAADGYAKKLGWAGTYPFTRGIQPSMYRGRPWTFRQYSGFGSAA